LDKLRTGVNPLAGNDALQSACCQAVRCYTGLDEEDEDEDDEEEDEDDGETGSTGTASPSEKVAMWRKRSFGTAGFGGASKCNGYPDRPSFKRKKIGRHK